MSVLWLAVSDRVTLVRWLVISRTYVNVVEVEVLAGEALFSCEGGKGMFLDGDDRECP